MNERLLYQEALRSADHPARPFRRYVIAADSLASPANAPSIDLLLWSVWEGITGAIPNAYAVMSATRHILLSYLFAQADWVQSVEALPLNEHSREKRFLAELLLHAIECKGMVNLSVMAGNCRLTHYKPESHSDIADVLMATGFLRRGQAPDVKETYFATVPNVSNFVDVFFRNFDCSAAVVEPVVAAAGGFDVATAKAARGFLEAAVQEIFGGEEVEVVPSCDRRPEWMFITPHTLGTYLELQDKTRDLLGENWTHLFVIAESGAWMTVDRMKERLKTKAGACVLCIETSMRGLEDWRLREGISARLQHEREDFAGAVPCRILRGELAWWKHNRHLTLAYNSKGNHYIGGIYFKRSLKSSQISAVYVDDQRDCAELLVTFLAYAKRITEDIEEERVDRREKAWRRNVSDIRECAEMLEVLAGIATVAPIAVEAVREKRDELLERINRFVLAARKVLE